MLAGRDSVSSESSHSRGNVESTPACAEVAAKWKLQDIWKSFASCYTRCFGFCRSSGLSGLIMLCSPPRCPSSHALNTVTPSCHSNSKLKLVTFRNACDLSEMRRVHMSPLIQYVSMSSRLLVLQMCPMPFMLNSQSPNHSKCIQHQSKPFHARPFGPLAC